MVEQKKRFISNLCSVASKAGSFTLIGFLSVACVEQKKAEAEVQAETALKQETAKPGVVVTCYLKQDPDDLYNVVATADNKLFVARADDKKQAPVGFMLNGQLVTHLSLVRGDYPSGVEVASYKNEKSKSASLVTLVLNHNTKNVEVIEYTGSAQKPQEGAISTNELIKNSKVLLSLSNCVEGGVKVAFKESSFDKFISEVDKRGNQAAEVADKVARDAETLAAKAKEQLKQAAEEVGEKTKKVYGEIKQEVAEFVEGSVPSKDAIETLRHLLESEASKK